MAERSAADGRSVGTRPDLARRSLLTAWPVGAHGDSARTPRAGPRSGSGRWLSVRGSVTAMLGLRDALDRFRRAGTPGPAARAGVPADRAADLAAELGPVLARLDRTQAECGNLRDRAIDEADQIRLEARQQATRLVADARRGADAVRAQAAAAEQDRSEAAGADVMAQASRRAARIRSVAELRMPVYVARVVELLLEEVRQEDLRQPQTFARADPADVDPVEGSLAVRQPDAGRDLGGRSDSPGPQVGSP
jgi:vacuolar-type H+-ATPase subunit H